MKTDPRYLISFEFFAFYSKLKMYNNNNNKEKGFFL